MKDIFRKILEKPIAETHQWFFYGFLITSTLSIRKVLFWYPVGGAFNEYAGAYIYLSDIFLFLILLFWLFSLCNSLSILSIITAVASLRKKCSTWNIFITSKIAQTKLSLKGLTFQKKINALSLPREMFHVEHLCWGGTFSWIKKTYQQVIHNYLTVFPLFIAFFSFISILWSDNKCVALFRSIKLFEFVLLYFYMSSNILNSGIEKEMSKMFHVEHFMDRVKSKCSTWNIFKNSLIVIISIGLFQAFVGIWQFTIQHSVGFSWLKESIISPEILGVAKVILHGSTYVRAYGLFPHPNIFGGFLVFSIISTLWYLKMFHPSTNVPSQYKCSTSVACSENVPRGTFSESMGWNIVRDRRGTFILKIIILIQAIALLLTFSKSAILGLLMGLFYIYIMTNKENVPRGTFSNNEVVAGKNIKCSTRLDSRRWSLVDARRAWNILRGKRKNSLGARESQNVPRGTFYNKLRDTTKMFHPPRLAEMVARRREAGVEHFCKMLFLIVGIMVLTFLIIKPDIYSLLFKSIEERGLYIDISIQEFLGHPLLGVGSGQFVIEMTKNYNLEFWQYQPVHNVFLLILNEFGIFIFFGFICFIYILRKDDESGKINVYLKATLLAFTFIMLFDHYFWDIQQGQILLWLVLGLVANSNRE